MDDDDLFSQGIFSACQKLWKLRPGDDVADLMIRCEAIVGKKAIVPTAVECANGGRDFRVTITEHGAHLLEDKRLKLPVVQDLVNVGPFGRKALCLRRDWSFWFLHDFGADLHLAGLIPACECDWTTPTQ
jgi:hypothetical protein